METINNKNHKNLQSNVAFEQLPKWFQEAKTKYAVVEFSSEYGFIWHKGIWKDGTWKNGIWDGGFWGGGTWIDGIWKHGFWKNGIWEDGFWEDGTWDGGTWKGGVWKEGVWNNGTWENGIWKHGFWKNGIWEYGVWLKGIWESGTEIEKNICFSVCKWFCYVNTKTKVITLGCKEKSVEEWNDFFYNSEEEYKTPRNTEAFQRIEKTFKALKCLI